MYVKRAAGCKNSTFVCSTNGLTNLKDSMKQYEILSMVLATKTKFIYKFSIKQSRTVNVIMVENNQNVANHKEYVYSNAELTDMLFVYGAAKENNLV
ncbi:hypothetical protein NQ317_015390 [Molorchus minor]|uniref:Uncharacterized protein n=1 Tax=Molorchus minor TaxID=1323400 RepID=A0ABQ9JG74_9CUCU|nr:hypothetical protein NQ317_015390 [Molorchus minor]